MILRTRLRAPRQRTGHSFLVRLLTGAAFVGAAILSTANPSHAGPRYLSLSNFTTSVNATDVSGTDQGMVAGVAYAHAIELSFAGATASILPHAFPGYTAFSFDVGLSDSGQSAGDTGELLVKVDGRTVKDLHVTYDRLARHVVIPFGTASTITLVVGPTTAKQLVIGNPQLRPAALAQPGTASGTTTVQIFSASVGAGGQETLLAMTGAAATLTSVIVYPDGSQQVVGPRQADADGHLAYTWTVPTGVTGTCRVVVVGAGVMQASFTIT